MNEELEKVVQDVECSAEQCCADIRQKAADLCNSVESYARQEPLKAVVIAAGVGLLAGLLVSRR